MKYIIDVPDGTKWIEAYYTVDYLRYQGDTIMVDSLIPYTEPDRKAIEDAQEKAWELASAIVCPSDCNVGSIQKHCKEIFGVDTWEIRGIFTNNTYQEAKAKYVAWRKKKDEIRVGDEVEYQPNKAKGIVIKCHVPDVFAGIDKYAVFTGDCVEYCPIEWLTKTGRSFSEVAELLKKMGDTE